MKSKINEPKALKKNKGAKILIFDVETAPNKVYTWGLYNQNIGKNQIIERGYMLCYCAKWVNEPGIMSDAIWNYPKHFRTSPRDDSNIAKSLWKLIDEADIVVAHNGEKFDLKWVNSVFLRAGLPPVSSYKSVDTLKHSRSNFYFVSHALENVSQELSLGKKVETGGFDLWVKAMKGQKLACNRMIRYCTHDVRLLDRLYRKIKPYIRNHPNLNLYTNDHIMRCRNCRSPRLKKKGFAYTLVSKFQRYTCLNCGRDQRGNKNLFTKEERDNLTRGIR